LTRAKEANEGSEADREESKHGEELYQKAGGGPAAMSLISKAARVLANLRDHRKRNHRPVLPTSVGPLRRTRRSRSKKAECPKPTAEGGAHRRCPRWVREGGLPTTTAHRLLRQAILRELGPFLETVSCSRPEGAWWALKDEANGELFECVSRGGALGVQKLNSATPLIQRHQRRLPHGDYVLHRAGCSQEDD
jgi:hypothetical protein